MSHQLSIHCCWSGPWNLLIPSKIEVFVYFVVCYFWRVVQVHKSCQKGQEYSEQWIVWLSFLLSINTLFLSLSLSHTHTYKDISPSPHTLADDAMLLYFLTLECLCPMIIVNLIDAVTWSVMGFQVIAVAVRKKHRFFLRRKGASAELGLRKEKKKHHFLISFSSSLTLLLKCKLPNTSCGETTWHIYSSFFLSGRKFQRLHLALFHLL